MTFFLYMKFAVLNTEIYILFFVNTKLFKMEKKKKNTIFAESLNKFKSLNKIFE